MIKTCWLGWLGESSQLDLARSDEEKLVLREKGSRVVVSLRDFEFWDFQNIKHRIWRLSQHQRAVMCISSPWELKADGLADPGGVHHVVHVHPYAVRRRAVPAVWREQDWRCVPLILRIVYYMIYMICTYMPPLSWGQSATWTFFGLFLSWEPTAI